MDKTIVFIFLLAFSLRITSLMISIKHEKKLKAEGAQEYGQFNTLVLGILHALFYIATFCEGYFKGVQFDFMAKMGSGLLAFSLFTLFYVIYALSPIWTVKLIIAKQHILNTNWLFKYIRHPNYFLNLLPELLGLTLLLHAYFSFLIIFPLYVISLVVRIRQEEKIMHTTFSNY